MSTIKINTCDKEWFGKDYLFFNKEGNSLNINYDEGNNMYMGDLYFDMNGSDTFKSESISMFERVGGFEYQQYNISGSQSSDELFTYKFQLFNERGVSFLGSTYSSSIITKIEAVNNDQYFYSKWVYGLNFDNIYPHGSMVKFDSTLLEFNNLNNTYTVVGSKKNAIMIISNVDNKSFNDSYQAMLNSTNTYSGKTISGVNVIKILDYVDSDLNDNFSGWSEPKFYDKVFNGQKISIIGSDFNDGVHEIINSNIVDNYYSQFKYDAYEMTGDVRVKLETKTNVPKIYEGSLEFESVNNIVFFSGKVPVYLRSGVEFKVPSSVSNSNNLLVGTITVFNKENNTTYIGASGSSVGSLVLYEKELYECIDTYEQVATSSVVPTNTSYWRVANFIPVTTSVINEVLYNANVFLTDNIINIYQNYDMGLSSIENSRTLSSYISDELSVFDAKITYDEVKSEVVSELIYPTEYLNISYYNTTVDSIIISATTSGVQSTGLSPSRIPFDGIVMNLNDKSVIISSATGSGYAYFSEDNGVTAIDPSDVGTQSVLFWNGTLAGFNLEPGDIVKLTYENDITIKDSYPARILEVDKLLINEINHNHGVRNKHELNLIDIDEYGMRVIINDKPYYIESTLIYDNQGEVNLPISIDKTIRRWVEKYKVKLQSLGILTDTKSVDNINEYLHDTIVIMSEYPNINVSINVEVGSTAEYFLLDSILSITEVNTNIGSFLNIKVNGNDYVEQYSTNIVTTVSNWVNTHYGSLIQYGIYVFGNNNNILFKKKETGVSINIEVFVGENYPIGKKTFDVVKKELGNQGLIISSNQIRQDNYEINFEDECFSTGQIISINSSVYPLNNQEYNVLMVDPNFLILSYQGAFWGVGTSSDNVNAFSTLAFGGEDVGVGDYVVFATNSTTIMGTVTNVTSTKVTVENSGMEYVIDKNLAFGYDAGATPSISIDPESIIQVSYVETDNSNFVDVNYDSFSEEVSLLGADVVTFMNSGDMSGNIVKNISSTSSSYIGLVNNIDTSVLAIGNDVVTKFDLINNIELGNVSVSSGLADIGDVAINSINGDVYISGSGSWIDIYDSNLVNKANVDVSGFNNNRLAYSYTQNMMYYGSVGGSINRINCEDNIVDVSYNLSTGTYSLMNCRNLDHELVGSLSTNPFDDSIYTVAGNKVTIINAASYSIIEDTVVNSVYSIIFNPFDYKTYILSDNGIMYIFDENQALVNSVNCGIYGHMVLNQYDGNIYIASYSDDKLYIYSVVTNQIFYNIDLDYSLEKIIYVNDSQSIVGFKSTENEYVTIKVDLISANLPSFSYVYNLSNEEYNKLSNGSIYGYENFSEVDGDNAYGTFATGSTANGFLNIKTREFIRRPRMRYESENIGNVKLNWVWEDNTIDEIFMFDFSGDHLPTGGSYAYTGEKPLSHPIIKKTPNKDVSKVGISYEQQTVFDSLTYSLEYNDSSTNFSFVPNGIQLFLGYNSKDEGVIGNTLSLYMVEDIEVNFSSSLENMSGVYDYDNDITFAHIDDSGDIYCKMDITPNAANSFNFSDKGFEAGQIIKINMELNSSSTEEYDISMNNDNKQFKVREVFYNTLHLDYVDDIYVEDNSTSDYVDDVGDGEILIIDYKITVMPRVITQLYIKGQTEIEDVRYKIELSNTGKLVNPEDVYIFKEYDVKEGGVDWVYMNRKRKEMLMVRNDIYNYIGSYKSIINAINYFGYNDLILYEYFKNVNIDSENYEKLFKIEIPDIFDNSVDGWSETGFHSNEFPNEYYDSTNLFNLSYNITDFEGNSALLYSLDEVLIKLGGLKKWLENNVIPITHEIRDITGHSQVLSQDMLFHENQSLNILSYGEEHTPIDFTIDEIYIHPISNGSTVYNALVTFTHSVSEIIPEYFQLDIRTYKTYGEWNPFVYYAYGDRVLYYGKLYENVLVDSTDVSNLVTNYNNNPLVYDTVEPWSVTQNYNEGDLVNYENRIYKYSWLNTDVNYPPFSLVATYSCVTSNESPSTTYFDDITLVAGGSTNAPSYIEIGVTSSLEDLDILNIIISYNISWCDLVDNNINAINSLINLIRNTSESKFVSNKPTTVNGAKDRIYQVVANWESSSIKYKERYKHSNPRANLLLSNADYILWDDITAWEKVKMSPVQKLVEYRSGSGMLMSYNFTVDTSVDPYVVIEVVSDNGYGQIYKMKKSYEIKYNADSDNILVKTL